MDYVFNRCFGCMKETNGEEVCPHCGYCTEKFPPSVHQLRPGTILNGAYVIGKVMGQGGFGITYIGWDLNLDRAVAIKEYYPSGAVTRDTSVSCSVISYQGPQEEYFNKGKRRFEKEAQILSKFSGNPQIVQVQNYFQGNNTAYIVMELLQGITLKEYTARKGGRIPPKELLDLMKPIVKTLSKVHEMGLIHRDISPDNLMLMPDNTLKLMDFGAAHTTNPDGEASVTILLKYGYAPIEQYLSHGNIGPWTDIHALCATMYYCLTGQVPKEALERQEHDDTRLPDDVEAQMTKKQVQALKKGMAVKMEDRYQTMEDLYKGLYEATEDPKPIIKKKGIGAAKIAGFAVGLCAAIGLSVAIWPSESKEPKDVKTSGFVETLDIDIGIDFDSDEETTAAKRRTTEAETEAEAEAEAQIETWTDSAGHQYQGVRVNGVLDGFGICTYGETENGLKEYIGDWKNGKRDGTGTLTWLNGEYYEGDWKDDHRHGTGSQYYNDGATYIGEWENGIRQGAGIYTWSDGDTYEGEWEDGEQSGVGTYTWSNGDVYEGEWENGIKSGVGFYTWSDGKRYEGEWANDRREGIGTMYYTDGTSQTGLWENDEMVEVIESTEETQSQSQYIFPDSDSRYMRESELTGLSAETLRLGRNEIYARHGRKFTDEALQKYFDSQPWYRGTIEPSQFNDDTYLNSYEKANRDLISKYEEKMRY